MLQEMLHICTICILKAETSARDLLFEQLYSALPLSWPHLADDGSVWQAGYSDTLKGSVLTISLKL